jgi:ABC-type nitrate/sulfonate/bicarbonate transport system substrate-binding protein
MKCDFRCAMLARRNGKHERHMDWDRRAFTAVGSAFFTAFAGVSRAQQLEKPSLRLGVGNKPHLYYLPLTLAERRGYFEDYGLSTPH